MSQLAVAAGQRTGFKFTLTVREGPDLGVSYQLFPPRVSIGRGPECHVALSDPRVSRNAAVIEFSMERILITDVSSRQSLYVNRELVEQASIKDGDIIQIGDTEMTFFVEALALAFQPPPVAASPADIRSGQPLNGPRFQPQTARGPRPPYPAVASEGLSPRLKIYGGFLIILIFGAWLLLSENGNKSPEQGIRTVEEIEKEISESEIRQEDLSKKRIFQNEEERTRFEEANRHFREGFRDYQKGQYVRAMRSFETARAIDNKHPLAERYYKLAEKSRDELIASLTLEARRYREKNMFGRCSAQFDKVLGLIPNKDDIKYKSAEALKKECDLHLEGRFRY